MTTTKPPANTTPLEHFYYSHHQWLYNHLRHRLGNNAAAEDICQDIFLHLCENPEQLNNIREPRAYLATVANRQCIDYFRHNTTVRKTLDDFSHAEEPTQPSAEQQASNHQILISIHNQLQRIPSNKAAVFIDSRIHQHTLKEAAKRQGISLRTANTYLQQTISLLSTIEPTKFQRRAVGGFN